MCQQKDGERREDPNRDEYHEEAFISALAGIEGQTDRAGASSQDRNQGRGTKSARGSASDALRLTLNVHDPLRARGATTFCLPN